MPQVFETVLPGFDGTTDDTDSLVAWIYADHEEQVRACLPPSLTLETVKLRITDDLSEPQLREYGIDYILPKDADTLRERAHPPGPPPSAATLPGPEPGTLGMYLKDPNGRWAASYMPAREVGGEVAMADPDSAQFWGVYRYDVEGVATCVGDAHDADSAAAFAELVRRDVLRERGFVDVTHGPVAVSA